MVVGWGGLCSSAPSTPTLFEFLVSPLVEKKKKLKAAVCYLLCRVDAAERCNVAVFVSPKNFAHGAGRRLAGQAVDVDLLFIVFLAHELLLLLLWLHIYNPVTVAEFEKIVSLCTLLIIASYLTMLAGFPSIREVTITVFIYVKNDLMFPIVELLYDLLCKFIVQRYCRHHLLGLYL